ncbi:MAG: ammonium transporter [Planctomycetota bacterium]
MAQEETEADVPSVVEGTGDVAVTFDYDIEALTAAVEEAEADEETGEKSAVIEGVVIKTYAGGLTEEVAAVFTMTLGADGTSSTSFKAAGAATPLYAGEDDDGNSVFVSSGQYRSNNIWVLIAAGLVFIMHLGFGCVESGLTRAKNAVNVLTKNLWIIASGILLYWVWGFNAHYPGSWVWEGVIALPFPAPWLDPTGDGAQTATYYGGSYTIFTDFIFQAMFAATAATIVSGAVAERIKLAPFMVFAVVFVGFGYPFVGSWHWGGGWLGSIGDGFYDFAGSSVVHAFGGFGALAGVLLLGPRIGKYGPNGEVRGIPGHNIPLVNVGVFLLFLGWFGFNGGSVLSADEVNTSLVFTTTTLAGVAGGAVALLTSWAIGGKPDLTMGLNGLLAGLVGITAGADSISPGWSIVVGGIAGVIVVLSVYGFDKIGIDDPVGAISVHGVCGIWGTVAVGIFGGKDLVAQIIGTIAVSVTAFLIALVIFGILKVLGGIRVSEEEEIEGLDMGEHGMRAYHDLAGTPATA